MTHSAPEAAGSRVAGDAELHLWRRDPSTRSPAASQQPLLTAGADGATWSKQSSGIGSELIAVSFIDATHGWAVGWFGTILATINGGTTWSAQGSGSGEILHSVAFISDASHGWAVGDNGTILATINGGTTWSAQSSGSSENLYGVAFIDATHGWAVGTGGTILATTNGGAAWSKQSSGTSVYLKGPAFIDATHGWAVGDGGLILATTNGGATWSAQSSGTTEELHAVAFSDATHGWAVGYSGTILATTNGGWPPAPTFTLTPSVVGGASGHGTISPATAQTVSSGATPTFSFAPAAGYHVSAVTVGGGAVTMTAANEYTFPAVTADHALSVAFALNPKPLLGKPVCPKSVKHGKRFKLSGTLRPHFAAGLKTIKLKAYRYVHRKWKLYKSYAAVNADSGADTKYVVKIKLTKKGKYRFKAFTAATAELLAARTGFSRTLTVK